MSSKSYMIPAIERTMEILKYIGHDEVYFLDIVNDLSIPKSSAYSIVQSMLELGFLRKTGKSSRIALGFRLFELGNLSIEKLDLRKIANPFMKNLVLQENLLCHLGRIDGHEAFYLSKIQPKRGISVESREGRRIALRSSGLGKAMLAWQKPDVRKALLEREPLPTGRTNAITDPDVLENHLADIRARGWAIDDEEDMLGIRCVAAPIFDIQGEVIAGISVTGMVVDMPYERIDRLARCVVETANNISRAIGSDTPTDDN